MLMLKVWPSASERGKMFSAGRGGGRGGGVGRGERFGNRGRDPGSLQ